jgi:nucleoside-diphosphate-sugar epimerase
VAALDDRIGRQSGRNQVIKTLHELSAGERLRGEGGGRETVQLFKGNSKRVRRVDDRLAFPARQGLRNLAMLPERDRQDDCVGKARAESIVLKANKLGFRALALRPPALWGPSDPFSRALPQAVNSGQFAFINRGDYAFDTCHVDNIVEAVRCALARGEGGRAFFITGQEKLTFREFIASLASVQGLSIEKLSSMPYGIASTLGRLFDAVWAIARKDGDLPISRSMMRMIGREFSVNDDSARRELGYVGRTSRAMGLRSYG